MFVRISECGKRALLCAVRNPFLTEVARRSTTSNRDQRSRPRSRQIAATDAEIDRLVYKLYGLTDEEIKIVEGQR
jgi:hypothetical protein